MVEIRAPREEIFFHLETLLGHNAVIIAENIASQYISGEKQEALTNFKKYDSTLGGIGIYRSNGKKLPGIYRALSYTEIPMLLGYAHESGRLMVYTSCGYLEELIKKLVFLWPWEQFKTDGLPLGVLIGRIEKRLPIELARELRWLNKSVGIFAKHHFNMQQEIQTRCEPDRYFELDEALAVYLIARVLGRRLENLSGKPVEAFLDGWGLPE